MRVDEGRASWNLPAINVKAHTVGRGEKSLLGDPGSDLHLGREKDRGMRAKIIEGMSNTCYILVYHTKHI